MKTFEETELFEYIQSFGFETIRDAKDIIPPYELDIVIPSKKLAIEFNGLFWHSDKFKHNSYHLIKTELCEQKGYRLIHVFENEWKNKKDIVKSILKNILGKTENKIYARKCNIKRIHQRIAKKFLKENHLVGYVPSKISYGLYFNNELLSVMSFAKSRFSKNHQWELTRFANKLNYRIIGGATKIFKRFIRDFSPVSIVSYADRRWFSSNLYNILGFSLIGTSKPNFWRYNDETRELSLKIRGIYKRKNNNSIDENIEKSKTYRVFDCGNYIFEKILKNEDK